MSDRTLTDKENGSVLVALGDDASTKLAVAGGKGASLGRLIKAGFSVPSGFVITTDAYAECLRANDLEAKIEQILAKLDYDNFDQLEQETAKIREAVAGCKLPDSLAGEIVGAYGGLGTEPYVAVRSWGRRRIWRVRPSLGCTTRTLMSGAATRCWMPCCGVGHRCGPRGLLPIVRAGDSTTVTPASP